MYILTSSTDLVNLVWLQNNVKNTLPAVEHSQGYTIRGTNHPEPRVSGKEKVILYKYRNITLTYIVFIILGIKFAIIIICYINSRGWEFCKCNHLMRVLAPVMKSILSTEADSVGGLGGFAGKYTSISNRTKTAHAASTTPDP